MPTLNPNSKLSSFFQQLNDILLGIIYTRSFVVIFHWNNEKNKQIETSRCPTRSRVKCPSSSWMRSDEENFLQTDFSFDRRQHAPSLESHQCTMCTLYSFFSFRPNAVGHIVQPRDCHIIEHIFVPTHSVERNNEKIRFP